MSDVLVTNPMLSGLLLFSTFPLLLGGKYISFFHQPLKSQPHAGA